MSIFSKDATLSDSIRPVGSTTADEPASILLTGATGYLGSFLLHELLTTTAADVYCIVRADNEGHAFGRIRAKLSSYGLWEDSFTMRVVPVLGDMTRRGLGLTPVAFDELAERCDLVLHGAANVNFLFPYRALKAANVTAAVDMLRLASTGRQKPFHFVSTIGIFLSPDHAGGVISESDPLSVLPERANGYSQTKWVAERLMMAARERGIPVTIHRPGFVGWHSRTGVMNDKDFVTGILDASLALGRAPDVSMTLDVAPVDYVVRAMAWLAARASSAGKTYHLNNPEPWTWRSVVEAFRSEGAMLEWVSYERWRSELSQRRESALNRFATMLPERVDEAGSIFTALSAPPTFEFDAVKSDLAGSGITCGGLDANLVAAFFRNPGAGHRVPRAESSTQLIRAADALAKTG